MWTRTPSLGLVSGRLPHVTGQFYDSCVHTALTTLTLSTNTLYAIPFLVPQTKSYTTIAIEVTTQSAGNNARLGIYSDSNGVPDALVLDAGTISLTGTGAKTITISQSLPAGWYWLALVSNGAATLRATSTTNPLPWLGSTSGTDTTFHLGWSVAFTYGTLPNPFTGGGALLSGAAPRLMLAV